MPAVLSAPTRAVLRRRSAVPSCARARPTRSPSAARRWLLLLLAAVGLLGPATPAQAVRVQLRARTDLRLQAVQRELTVVVRGELVEARGPGVPGATVDLTLSGPTAAAQGGPTLERTVQTGEGGRYELVVPLDEVAFAHDALRVQARYLGGSRHGDAQAQLQVDLHKLETTLELQVPTEPVATDAGEVEVEVRARSDELPLAGIPVSLSLDGAPWLVVRTGGDGLAVARLPLARLARPGPHVVTATCEATEQFNAAHAQARLTVTAAVQVALRLAPGQDGDAACPEGDWCVTGSVHARLGGQDRPLANAAVTLHAERRQLGALVTDATGRYAAVLRGEAIARLFAPGPVGLVARAHVPAPFHDVGWSAIAVLDVPTPRTISTWLYGAALLLLLAATAWSRWRARDREKALLAEREATSAGLPTEAVRRVGPGGEASCRLRGRIVHGETGRSAPGRLALHDAAAPGAALLEIACLDGTFHVEVAPVGQFVLRVDCLEHEPLELPIELPHDGTLDGCELLPASHRAVVRGAFAASVRRTSGRPVQWATETPRDAEPRWAAALRRGHGEVRDAVRRVERALYGPRTEADTAAEARRAVARVDEVQR